MAAEKLDTLVRQEQIIQAALSLIGSHGLRRLSVASLARRIGLVPSALYRHFKGKDDVIEAVLQHIRDSLQENVRSARAETTDPLECLRRLLMRHLAMVRDNAALPRIVFSEDVYAGRPARRARMFAGIRTYLDDVAAIVQQGQADGQIRPDVDPQTVATLFLGLIQPGAILWHMSDGAFDVTRHAERGWRLLSDTLRTTTAPVPPRPRPTKQR
ncbi:MAG TPA: TetR/AcrR family transcriptional regulator [Vicinamibacterales bacterium]